MELDPKTLERALKGDRDSFHVIASQCWGMVFVFVRQRVRDAEFARDLTQETFLTAFAKRESLRSEESFVSWLLTIASRKIIDFRRRRGVRPEVPLGEPEGHAASATVELPDAAERAEEAGLLQESLDQLDDRYRTVLILRYWSGLTPAQISRLLREPEGTIRNRIFRAHAQLRKRFEEVPTARTTNSTGDKISAAHVRQSGLKTIRGVEQAERRT